MSSSSLDFRAAVTSAVGALVAAVLLLQLAFCASSIGALRAPSSHGIRTAVVAPEQARDRILAMLNGLHGTPVQAVAVKDEATARSQIERREVDVAFVMDPAEKTDTLLIAMAIGPAETDVAAQLAIFLEEDFDRQIKVVDISPPANGDWPGPSSPDHVAS
ncbi:hypothetical protein [Actinomadura rudentiformis]|uniref:Uncharacterized protein n=1 Tax=Actinomadura rudentiformis TaxID=359158 RepID=A0A6H9Z901_9ACTN|nr:hypothetical protein [Actinomadura rudentiformis]KAB2350366.1 hypothetical protein F8566_11390 [Actinomadura rudentiformis]